MMSHADVEKMVMALPQVWLDYPFGEGVAVYKIKSLSDKAGEQSKMFALIQQNQTPLKLSLKCDPQLAELLREKYETVLPGFHLNKKHWNTIICSGQVPDDELQDMIRHSYELVKPSR